MCCLIGFLGWYGLSLINFLDFEWNKILVRVMGYLVIVVVR